MGMGFGWIQKCIDLRVNLINGLLGHEFSRHAQSIAHCKGFQYAFQNSQAISLISFVGKVSQKGYQLAPLARCQLWGFNQERKSPKVITCRSAGYQQPCPELPECQHHFRSQRSWSSGGCPWCPYQRSGCRTRSSPGSRKRPDGGDPRKQQP